ncbi:glycoside hydrolase family 125 protein [Aerococcus vaginalis]
MTNEQQQAIYQLKAWAKKQDLGSQVLNQRFRELLPDTLEKATQQMEDGTYFVTTGDIPAMWLRDATFQVLPYVSLIDEIPELASILRGVLQRELKYVLIDPYANAFNITANGAHWDDDDQSDQPTSDWVWERKYEIDSLCAPLLLAMKLQDKHVEGLFDDLFWEAYAEILTVFETEQKHAESPYFFIRENAPENDALYGEGGRGLPVRETGLIWNGFRPSDNASQYGYHIPDNIYAHYVLKGMAPHITDDTLKARTDKLIDDIQSGLEQYAFVILPTGERGYAYEVDGLGNAALIDDANVPSLLSLPFISDIDFENSDYQHTRAFILSEDNPYYYKGKALAGIGSEHTPENYVWAISLLMEGITYPDTAVKREKLQLVCDNDGDTGQCHEGIHVDDPTQYTREWFSWANMTFCQLALQIILAK